MNAAATRDSAGRAFVEMYDTTLRDGSQQVGLDLTVEDKLRVAAALDALGVDVVEGGWPGSNPKDKEFFARAGELPWRNAQLAAFGATRRPNRSADGDPDLETLLVAKTPIVTLVGKAWTLHVDEALRTTREENLAMVADSVRFFVREGRRAVFDAEHFFDGYAADRSYALACLSAAAEAGRCLTTSCVSSGTSSASSRPSGSGCTAITTPPARLRTRWSRSARARRMCRGRPTGTASGAATPTCSP